MPNQTRDPENSARTSTVPKRLIFRLSSLGDVILASAALEAVPGSDWVVAREFADVLRGHPKVGKIWEYDRRSGLGAWRKLMRDLAAENYVQVFDLHQSLRTRLAQKFFNADGAKPEWRVLKKPRGKLIGYFTFKQAWSPWLRPKPVLEQLTRLFESKVPLRPDLRHLLLNGAHPPEMGALKPGTYYCLMPSAQWIGKQWPVAKFTDLARRLHAPVVVLGTERDLASQELAFSLQKEGKVQIVSLVGKASLRQAAQVLAQSKGYIGNDTGLAHLAEAVGVPAHVIFGPTRPDQGFGPWREGSSSSEAKLWCRPCGKDGRACFRQGENRYLCLKTLSSDAVLSSIEAAERGQFQ